METIPTSEEALRQATIREMNSLPPCRKVKDQKIGARDAAIWLTAIEYAQEHPEETVYFASANTSDFGSGDEHPTLVRRDVEKAQGRFRHWTSLDEALAEFAKPVEGDDSLAKSILESSRTIKGIRAALRADLHHMRTFRSAP